MCYGDAQTFHRDSEGPAHSDGSSHLFAQNTARLSVELPQEEVL